jgi:hypothetical protein
MNNLGLEGGMKDKNRQIRWIPWIPRAAKKTQPAPGGIKKQSRKKFYLEQIGRIGAWKKIVDPNARTRNQKYRSVRVGKLDIGRLGLQVIMRKAIRKLHKLLKNKDSDALEEFLN